MFVTQQPQQRVMVQQASRGGNSRAAIPQQVMMANSSKNIVQVQQQPIQQPVSQVRDCSNLSKARLIYCFFILTLLSDNQPDRGTDYSNDHPAQSDRTARFCRYKCER